MKNLKKISRKELSKVQGGYVKPLSCGDSDSCSSGLCINGRNGICCSSNPGCY